MTKTMSLGQIITNAKAERPKLNPVLVALRVTRVAADLTGRPLLTIYREDEVSNADASGSCPPHSRPPDSRQMIDTSARIHLTTQGGV